MVLATLVGGSLAAGSANALNCYLDRDIDAADAAHRAAPAGPARGLAPGRAGLRPRRSAVVSIALMAGVHQLARRRADRRRDRSTTTWSTRCGSSGAPPQNIVWGGVCGAHAGADRLGRGDRLAGLAAGGAVRGRVLLAAAALLGAGHPVQGRLRPGRHPDAAGGRHAAAGGPPDRRLHLAHRGAPRCCSGRWPPRGCTGRSRWPPAPGSWPRAHGLLARVKRGGPARTLPLFHLSNSYLAILFVGVAVDALVR